MRVKTGSDQANLFDILSHADSASKRKSSLDRFSILDSIYFALITATTVGYGDIRPKQKVSKLIAVCIALLGLITTGIIVTVGVLATQEAVDRHYDREEIREQIECP